MKHERLVLKDFLSCLKNLISFGHMKGVIPCQVILNIEKYFNQVIFHMERYPILKIYPFRKLQQSLSYIIHLCHGWQMIVVIYLYFKTNIVTFSFLICELTFRGWFL